MNLISELIEFNKPYINGNEGDYISQALRSGKITGDGPFTKKCQDFFETNYGFKKTLLTTSCTDALEMAAILLDIKEGDEIIAPSYTFVSTVNAFVLRGAKIRFVDSTDKNPNLDVEKLEGLITPRTKAIIPVHYGGIACDMDKIIAIAQKHNLFIVEDAAQAIDSFYKGRPLGSIGQLGAFSFHGTKNIVSGEGGMLVINDLNFANRAEIIREKGTNRAAFFRGDVDKYGWVDVGSSFLPSDIIAAFLLAQLEKLETIQTKRKEIWEAYYNQLMPLEKEGKLRLPYIPDFATNNGHVFYVVCKNLHQRIKLIEFLKKNKIQTAFHYISLHSSPFYKNLYQGPALSYADQYTDCLLRLPLFYELSMDQVDNVCNRLKEFFNE